MPIPPDPRRGAPYLHRSSGWAVAFACLVLAGAGSAVADDREAELARLRANIAELQERIERTRSERDVIQQRLRDTETRIGDISRRLRGNSENLDQNRREMERLTGAADREQTNLSRQRRALEAQIRAAYAMGKQQYIKMLLNQEDPAAVGRVSTYYKYLNDARSRRIESTLAALSRLQDLTLQIRQRRTELETLQGRLMDDKVELEDSRNDRANVLEALNREMRSQAQEIERLKRDEEYLLRLIEGLNLYLDELREDRAGQQAFDRFRGRLKLPAQARLTARFGEPRKGELTWEGLFLEASEGQDVHAVFRGRVAFADWFGNLGLLLIIDHGDGFMSLYGHNQSLYAEVGDWVETGQLVSSAGNSGGLEQPGLYFEIRQNGVPRNPLLWVRPS